jgi:hypothetical protein
MTTCSNPRALGWKHPGVQGINTRKGVIADWPDELGNMPTQSTVDGWVAEYEARDEGAEIFDKVLASGDQTNEVLRKLIKALNDGTFIPGEKLTAKQLQAILKP